MAGKPANPENRTRAAQPGGPHHQPVDSSPRQRGFTLVEMMITLAILAVLSVVAFVAYTRWKARAKTSEAIQMIHNIGSKQVKYFELYSRYINAPFNPTAVGAAEHEWDFGEVNWKALGVRPDSKRLYYQYWTQGSLTGNLAAGHSPAEYGIPAEPNTNAHPPWFLIMAYGDVDGDGKMSTFLKSSHMKEIHMSSPEE